MSGARTACGFGDMDCPRHAAVCLMCRAVLNRERRAATRRRLWLAIRARVTPPREGAAS